VSTGLTAAGARRAGRLQPHPRFGPLRSPGAGEHSRQALRTAGLTDAEIDCLIDAGTVVAGDPMPQALPTAYR
jgi:hypothetical protein